MFDRYFINVSEYYSPSQMTYQLGTQMARK